MLARHDAAVFTSRPSPILNETDWAEPTPIPIGCLREAEPLDALNGDLLTTKFRGWRGRSGRRYIFSVFDSVKCPAYRDAVLIAVAVETDGARRPIAFADTGAFPEPLLSQLARSCSTEGGKYEFHLHLLAKSAADRRSILEDLREAA